MRKRGPKINLNLITRSLYLTWFVPNNEIQQYRTGHKFSVLNNKVYTLKRSLSKKCYCVKNCTYKSNVILTTTKTCINKYSCSGIPGVSCKMVMSLHWFSVVCLVKSFLSCHQYCYSFFNLIIFPLHLHILLFPLFFLF
jgi:hypothetical protein